MSSRKREVGELERRQFTTEIKGIDVAKRQVKWTISTGRVDRHGDTIAVDGWELEEYRRNPAILFAHDSRALPIAKCVDVHIDSRAKALVATGEFIEKDVYPFADTVFQMIRGGHLRATSVGFRPIEFEFAKDREPDPHSWFLPVDFKRQELLEFSVVPIPANPDALITNAKSKGLDMAPMVDWAERFVRASGRNTNFTRYDAADDDIDLESITLDDLFDEEKDIDLDALSYGDVERIIRDAIKDSIAQATRRAAGKVD